MSETIEIKTSEPRIKKDWPPYTIPQEPIGEGIVPNYMYRDAQIELALDIVADRLAEVTDSLDRAKRRRDMIEIVEAESMLKSLCRLRKLIYCGDQRSIAEVLNRLHS